MALTEPSGRVKYVNIPVGGSANAGTGTAGDPYQCLNYALQQEKIAVPDLTSGTTDGLKIICKSTSGTADTTLVSSSNATFTTSPDHCLWITVDAASRHAGIYPAAGYRLEVTSSTSTTALNICSPHTHVDGMAIKLIVTSTNYGNGLMVSALATLTSPEIVLDGLIVVGDMASSSSTNNCVGVSIAHAQANAYLRNSIIYGVLHTTSTKGYGINVSAGTAYIQNCTSVENYIGIRQSSTGVLNIVNSYAGGNTSDDIQGTVSSFTTSACADSLAAYNTADLTEQILYDTTTGAGHAGFVSVTAGNADYLKLQADSVLVSAGTNQSYTTDVAGNARTSTYDIGAFEYVGGGGAVVLTANCTEPQLGGSSF